MPDAVRMSAVVHPLKTARKDLYFEEGKTISQMLAVAQPDARQIEHARVFISGDVIPREKWDTFRPKSGALVEVRAFPVPRGGDGGKNPLRIILTIAVIAFAAWAGPALAGLIGFSSEAIAAGGLAGFTAAAFSGITAAVGMLAVNAIAPVRAPQLAELSSTAGQADSPTLFINGARNALNPFAPVPVVLGKYRYAPPYGCKSYTEVVGDKQFVRMLFIWGIGPIKLDTSSIKIGDTYLTEFEGYQIEHREGYPTDGPLTLFPDAVSQQDFSVLISQATGWVTRTSEVNADELSVDFTLASGLVQYDDRGNRMARQVSLEIEYSLAGENDWQKIDTSNTKFQSTAPSSWFSKSGNYLNSITFNHNRTSAVRHGFRWGVASRGQYDIRVRRTTADSDSTQIFDEVHFTALRTITNEDPVNSPVPIARTALVIQATDQLNNYVDELTGIPTRVCLDWDSLTQAWIERATQNPASLFRFVLQGNGMSQPLADSRIDLLQLQEWHEFCVEKGFKFNQVRDFSASVWDTLTDIAQAGRAAPTQIDGKWSVVIEQEQTSAVSHITPRNSFDFKAERVFLNPPHAWRIPFPNEEEDYRFDERRVPRDGYDDDNATLFEQLEFPGVTDPEQIYTLGRFRIAQVMLQQERWYWKQDMEYMTYRRGSRVKVTHDVLLVGLAYGRIKAVIMTGPNVTGLVLDEEVTMENGKDYGISIRTLTGQYTRQVITYIGTTKTITLASPIAGSGVLDDDGNVILDDDDNMVTVTITGGFVLDDEGNVIRDDNGNMVTVESFGSPVEDGNIFGFGIYGQEDDDASIIAIVPDNNLRAQVVAVPYRSAIFDADSEEIPEFTTNLTPLKSIPAPSVRSVISDESALSLGPGDAVRVRIGIEFDPLGREMFGVEPELRIQMRPSNTNEPFFSAAVDSVEQNHVYITGVKTGEAWDIRLRFYIPGRLPGPWAYIYGHQVVGKSTPPSPLANMTISVFGAQALIRWDRPTELDVVFGGEVVFRHSPSFDSPSWSESVTIGQAARARTLYAVLPLKPGSYMARVYDVAGNPSTEITVVTTKQASVHAFSSVDSIDEAPGWIGNHDGTVEYSGNLKIDDSASPVFLTGTYKFANGIDLGSVKRVRMTTRIAVSIYRPADTIDSRVGNIDTWEDFDGALQAGADAKIYVRHTDDNPSGSPVSWSTWERIDSAEFEARGFEFYIFLNRESADYNILISELGVDIDEIA